jgi:flagellar biogenesis protein FliO
MIRTLILAAALLAPLATAVAGDLGEETTLLDSLQPAPLPQVEAFPTPMAAPLARILAALCLISAGGALLAWWSRKRRGIRPGNEHRIQVLASRGIGPRHNVVLLEVGDHRLLIGTAPESVTTLADLSEIPAFAEQLAGALPERRGDEDPTEILGTLERLDA